MTITVDHDRTDYPAGHVASSQRCGTCRHFRNVFEAVSESQPSRPGMYGDCAVATVLPASAAWWRWRMWDDEGEECPLWSAVAYVEREHEFDSAAIKNAAVGGVHAASAMTTPQTRPKILLGGCVH